jgi:hypothetical protein
MATKPTSTSDTPRTLAAALRAGELSNETVPADHEATRADVEAAFGPTEPDDFTGAGGPPRGTGGGGSTAGGDPPPRGTSTSPFIVALTRPADPTMEQ